MRLLLVEPIQMWINENILLIKVHSFSDEPMTQSDPVFLLAIFSIHILTLVDTSCIWRLKQEKYTHYIFWNSAEDRYIFLVYFNKVRKHNPIPIKSKYMRGLLPNDYQTEKYLTQQRPPYPLMRRNYNIISNFLCVTK